MRKRWGTVIKVIVGHKLGKAADIHSIVLMLLKLTSNAMAFSGFMGAENLRSSKDNSIVALLSNWERLEDWKAWESSKVRQQILGEGDTLGGRAEGNNIYDNAHVGVGPYSTRVIVRVYQYTRGSKPPV